MRIGLFAILCLLCLRPSESEPKGVPEPTTLQLAGRQVQVEVVKKGSLNLDSMFGSTIELAQLTHKFQTGENVSELLNGEGIRPDIEAITLVYDLNPKVSNLNNLKAGDDLVLPATAEGSKNALRSANDVLLITLDPELRNRFRTLVLETNTIVSRRKESQDGTSSDANDIQTKLIQVNGILEQIRLGIAQGNGPPLTHRDLVVFVAQAEFTRDMCAKIFSHYVDPSEIDRTRLNSVSDDLKVESNRYNDVMSGQLPESTCKYTVSVKVPRVSQSAAQTLRVYYIEEGLWTGGPTDAALAFPDLGESSDHLCWRIYRIWGARDGHPTLKVTEVLQRLVQRDESLTLSILGD